MSDLDFHPPVIAHRGARWRAPENTMAAFRAARDDGARWIETDVKLTADGVPVLMHDDMVDRTTNGKGAVAAMTLDDLRGLDAGGWFGADFRGEAIPRLADVLSFALGAAMRVNVELKPCPGRSQATAMVALLEAAKLWPKDAPSLLISSFDIECLMVAAQLHPDWPRGLLLDGWRDDWRDVMAATGARTLNIDADCLTDARLDVLAKAGVTVLAYTVNDAGRARHLINQGVRAVFADNPGEMIPLL